TTTVARGAISVRDTADRRRAASSRRGSRRRVTGRAAFPAWCGEARRAARSGYLVQEKSEDGLSPASLLVRTKCARGDAEQGSAAAYDRQRNRRETVEADRARGSRRKVDHPATHERTAVVDAHDHRAPGAPIGDLDHRAERQGAMCRREAARPGNLAI